MDNGPGEERATIKIKGGGVPRYLSFEDLRIAKSVEKHTGSLCPRFLTAIKQSLIIIAKN
jgi:hypothetical protein